MNQLDQAKISDRKIKADRDFIQPELITGTESLCQLTWLETSRNSPTYLSKGRPPCRRQHSLSPASDIGLVRSSVTTSWKLQGHSDSLHAGTLHIPGQCGIVPTHLVGDLKEFPHISLQRPTTLSQATQPIPSLRHRFGPVFCHNTG